MFHLNQAYAVAMTRRELRRAAKNNLPTNERKI
jgi:hypothetical protein